MKKNEQTHAITNELMQKNLEKLQKQLQEKKSSYDAAIGPQAQRTKEQNTQIIKELEELEFEFITAVAQYHEKIMSDTYDLLIEKNTQAEALDLERENFYISRLEVLNKKVETSQQEPSVLSSKAQQKLNGFFIAISTAIKNCIMSLRKLFSPDNHLEKTNSIKYNNVLIHDSDAAFFEEDDEELFSHSAREKNVPAESAAAENVLKQLKSTFIEAQSQLMNKNGSNPTIGMKGKMKEMTTEEPVNKTTGIGNGR